MLNRNVNGRGPGDQTLCPCWKARRERLVMKLRWEYLAVYCYNDSDDNNDDDDDDEDNDDDDDPNDQLARTMA